jgi:hypothetical protein
MIRQSFGIAALGAGLFLAFLVPFASQDASATGVKKKTKKRTKEVYHDPQGRFSFERYPSAASTVTASGDTVVIRGRNLRDVLQKVSAATPEAAIQQTLENLPTPLKKLKEVERGRSSFGGGDGLFAVYTGQNAQGKDWVVRIVSSGTGWVYIEDNIMQRLPGTTTPGIIETSFKLTDDGRADSANAPALPPAKDLPALTEALQPRDQPILTAARIRELRREEAAQQAILAGAQPSTDQAAATGAQASVTPALAPYQVFAASHMGVAYYMAVTDFIVLFPDGYALGALPAQGMDGFNLQAYMQQMGRTPNAIARYQMFPDHLELAYSNFPRSYALPGAGAPGSLVPLCLCNGTTFGGVFAYGNLMVQFNPDGSFVDRGALDNVVWKWFGAPRLTQGRYALQFNTLYLQTTDGRQGRISFAAPAAQEGSGSFDWIALNQKTARRVQ